MMADPRVAPSIGTQTRKMIAFFRLIYIFTFVIDPRSDVGVVANERIVPKLPQTREIAMSNCKILFLAANPQGTGQLSLDEESRQIDQKIRASDHRDVLEFIPKFAVRPDDLLQYLNQATTEVVHFSGHGSPTDEIILLDARGEPKRVSKAAIKQLFMALKDNVRVVVLNACFSRPQAEAITEVIDCAVGMKKAIGYNAAIVFAASFYRAIGFGRSVQEAFDQGKTALMLEGIAEENTPELLVRQGADPTSIFLIGQSPSGISAPTSGALQLWREKLYALQNQEAIVADPAKSSH